MKKRAIIVGIYGQDGSYLAELLIKKKLIKLSKLETCIKSIKFLLSFKYNDFFQKIF